MAATVPKKILTTHLFAEEQFVPSPNDGFDIDFSAKVTFKQVILLHHGEDLKGLHHQLTELGNGDRIQGRLDAESKLQLTARHLAEKENGAIIKQYFYYNLIHVKFRITSWVKANSSRLWPWMQMPWDFSRTCHSEE